MRVSRAAVLFGGGFCIAAAPEGPDNKVTTLSKSTPAYIVGPNAYSTTTLYTTSYFTITECASDATECPTNALTVVTSAVFATTTTTICLVTTSPGFPSLTTQPEGLHTASLSGSVPIALPTASDSLPWTGITSTNNPTGSTSTPSSPAPGVTSKSGSGIPTGPGPTFPSNALSMVPPNSGVASGFPTTSSHGNLPLPTSGITIGPGPALPSTGPDVPSIPGTSPSYPGASASIPSISVSSGPHAPAPSVPSVSFSIVPTPSTSRIPSTSYPGISSTNPIPGVPPRPQPSSSAGTTASAGIPFSSYTGLIPIPGSSGPTYGLSQAPTSGLTTSPSNGNPVASRSNAPGFPILSSPNGTDYSARPTATTSASDYSPSETGNEGTKISSLLTPPVGPPLETSATLTGPAQPSNYPPSSGQPATTAGPSSSDQEGTLTTQITSIVTYPHTTFVVTVPLPTSSRNYSTETEGIHTSIGTDASAYIPTGSGSWLSATNNGTLNSPTPTSPIPINNEGPQAFGSGKSSVIAIVVALAFVHFA